MSAPENKNNNKNKIWSLQMSSLNAISPTSVSSQPLVSVPKADSSPLLASEARTPTSVSAIASTDAMVRSPSEANLPETIEPGIIYRMKQKFWSAVVSFVFKSAEIQRIEAPVNEKLPMIRFSDKFPGIDIPNIYTTDGVPAAEASQVQASTVCFHSLALESCFLTRARITSAASES